MKGKAPSFVSRFMAHRVLGPSAGVDVLHVSDPREGAAIEAQMDRLDVEICYCSVLDECWLLNDDRHEAVGACSPPARPFTE